MRRQGLHLDQAPPLHLPLRFFLTAPLFAVAAGLVLLWRGSALLQTTWSPHTVALTHLLTLGFISMVMCGALYQIVPVLVGSAVPRLRLAAVVHGGLCVGVPALAGGLLSGWQWLLPVALAALGIAWAVFLGQLTLALARAPSVTVTVASIAVAASSLLLAVSLGLLFAWELVYGWLPPDRATLTAVHLYLALGGWVGTLITGVGYALIPMFYLSTPFPRGIAWLVLACQGLMLLTGPLLAWVAPSRWWHLLPLGLAALAVTVFTGMVWRMLHARRRRISDATLRFWQVGMLALPLALAALAVHVLGQLPRWSLVFGTLYLLGFAGAAINGMLYKIVPFLVWLHRFSRHAGSAEMPLLKDIIAPRHMQWQWRAYALMLVLATAAAGSGLDVLARLAGLALVVAFGALALLLFRAARMKLPPAARTPARDRAGETAPPGAR
ncbi:MAG: hypothetical protein HY342_03440 [Candidatus Lambdaproteobacteria bacterium]|nr:hypothetical protein [Candidatus Lambdaproteobacteria bacterium]